MSTELYNQYKRILNEASIRVPQLNSNADELRQRIEICDMIRSTIASLEQLYEQGNCGYEGYKRTNPNP